jgi:hypothetical protein
VPPLSDLSIISFLSVGGISKSTYLALIAGSSRRWLRHCNNAGRIWFKWPQEIRTGTG